MKHWVSWVASLLLFSCNSSAPPDQSGEDGVELNEEIYRNDLLNKYSTSDLQTTLSNHPYGLWKSSKKEQEGDVYASYFLRIFPGSFKVIAACYKKNGEYLFTELNIDTLEEKISDGSYDFEIRDITHSDAISFASGGYCPGSNGGSYGESGIYFDRSGNTLKLFFDETRTTYQVYQLYE